MIISVKSTQQRGFATTNGAFAHSRYFWWQKMIWYFQIFLFIFRREVYGTGLEVVITMDLVGLMKAGMQELDKAKRDLGLKIEKSDRGAATFTVVSGQVNLFYYFICNIFWIKCSGSWWHRGGDCLQDCERRGQPLQDGPGAPVQARRQAHSLK